MFFGVFLRFPVIRCFPVFLVTRINDGDEAETNRIYDGVVATGTRIYDVVEPETNRIYKGLRPRLRVYDRVEANT